MDPLTILASAIAVGQAVDRVVSLSLKIKACLHAPDEIMDLIEETHNLKLVLNRLKSTPSLFPLQDLPTLHNLLAVLSGTLSRIEQFIQKDLVRQGTGDDPSQAKVNRWAWATKRHQVALLRQKLRDYRSLLSLQLVGINT